MVFFMFIEEGTNKIMIKKGSLLTYIWDFTNERNKEYHAINMKT